MPNLARYCIIFFFINLLYFWFCSKIVRGHVVLVSINHSNSIMKVKKKPEKILGSRHFILAISL